MFLVRQISSGIMYFLLFAIASSGVCESANSNSIKVKLSYKSKEHGNFNVKKFKLNHPINISPQKIFNHLISLKYIETFLNSKEERVFSQAEIKKLEPILMRAFARVDPNRIIHVELMNNGRVTSGDIFSFGKYLNWRFDSIRGETFFKKNDVREWNVFAWKLVPQKGQLFFKSGEENGKRLNKNWVVSIRALPAPDLQNDIEPLDSPEVTGLINKPNPRLEKKLKQLKNLYDKNLIDTEEYKIQQKKLFDELF
jgi:hypothetical protein